MQVWKDKVLGVLSLQQDTRGALDICSKLSSVYGTLDTLKLRLGSRLNAMTDRLDVWNRDNTNNLIHLNDKIKLILKSQVATTPPPLEPSVVTSVVFSLCLTTPIMDNNGIELGVFKGVMDEFKAFRAGNIKLNERLEVVKADVMAQGGVIFGQ